MADSNPANFANLPKDQLREIAAKGGHASHGATHSTDAESHQDRNADGTFASTGQTDDGRNPDGTFKEGSKLAQELGAQGGHAAHHNEVEKDGRNPDGTFKEGSKLASELGALGGHAAHEHDGRK